MKALKLQICVRRYCAIEHYWHRHQRFVSGVLSARIWLYLPLSARISARIWPLILACSHTSFSRTLTTPTIQLRPLQLKWNPYSPLPVLPFCRINISHQRRRPSLQHVIKNEPSILDRCTFSPVLLQHSYHARSPNSFAATEVEPFLPSDSPAASLQQCLAEPETTTSQNEIRNELPLQIQLYPARPQTPAISRPKYDA